MADRTTEQLLRSELELHDEIRVTLRNGHRSEWKIAGFTAQALLVYGDRAGRAMSLHYADMARVERRTSSNALGSIPALAPITKPSWMSTLAHRKIWLLTSLVSVPAPLGPM